MRISPPFSIVITAVCLTAGFLSAALRPASLGGRVVLRHGGRCTRARIRER